MLLHKFLNEAGRWEHRWHLTLFEAVLDNNPDEEPEVLDREALRVHRPVVNGFQYSLDFER